MTLLKGTIKAPAWAGVTVLLVSVMGTALNDIDYVIFDVVNEAVFVINPAAPVSAEVMLEWLRVANADELISLDVFDEHVDEFLDFPVLALPVAIIFPCIIRP